MASIAYSQSLIIALDTEPRPSETLHRVWRSLTRDIVPMIEQDTASDEALQPDYFSLKTPIIADWGVQPPPLRLGNPKVSAAAFRPIPGPIDVRISGGAPRLGAPRDLCLIGANARAESTAAVWQPSFHCSPLHATNVRLNADFTYDWKGERFTTPLAFSVAQLFRLGPYAAELSGAVRTNLEKPEAKPNDWSYRAVITLPFPE